MATTPSTSTQMGTETRTQILPTQNPAQPGFLGPNYDPSNYIPLPGDIGVHRGSDLSDVTNAIKGVAYYADVIGFGESSNNLTSGMNFQHYGVNYFMKTGAKCSNGADAWEYIATIPQGTALGTRVQKGLASAGLPAMRGLAPGMLEDVEDAIDPEPILSAMFAGAYPVCKQVQLAVGDEQGRIADPDTGDLWVTGPVQLVNGKPMQTQWVVSAQVGEDEWSSTPKTMNADGTPISGSSGTSSASESFFGGGPDYVGIATALGLSLLTVLAFGVRFGRK